MGILDILPENPAYLVIMNCGSMKWDNLKREQSDSTVLEKAADALKTGIKMSKSSVSTMRKAVKSGMGNKKTLQNDQNSKTIQVQYNPNSLRITSHASDTQKKEAAQYQEREIAFMPLGTSLTLSVELWMHSDHEGDTSVADHMNLLMTVMQKKKDKEIAFYWADMKFEGILKSFSGEYIMFHPSGIPATGRMEISISTQMEPKLLTKKIDTMLKNRTEKLIEE